MQDDHSDPVKIDKLKDYGGLNIGYATELIEDRDSGGDNGRYKPGAHHQRFKNKREQDAFDSYGLEDAPAEGGNDGYQRIMRFIDAVRAYGYREAQTDPLGLRAAKRGDLDADKFGITAEMFNWPAAGLAKISKEIKPPARQTVGQLLENLMAAYCGHVGCEFEHVRDRDTRRWLYSQMERADLYNNFSGGRMHYIYNLLLRAQMFEHFLHRAYPGQRWFSLEGLETALLFTDQIVISAGRHGTKNIIAGMAHRGRLNFLTHVVGKPYEVIMSEFSPFNPRQLTALEHTGWLADVKYHQGAEYSRDWDHDGVPDIRLRLMPNPSHLELAHPSVLGAVRALQDGAGDGRHAEAMALLMHGDAAFAGQGVVPEMLNMAQLEGYQTGGTIHLILNNQVGFTTAPQDSFSGEHASDVARGYDIPILHVNADDVAACIAAADLAVEYRRRFGKDFLVDLVGYRRFGHNENDDPSFTHPVMYSAIAKQPTVLDSFAEQMIGRGIITREQHQQNKDEFLERMFESKKAVDSEKDKGKTEADFTPPDLGKARVRLASLATTDNKMDAAALRSINAHITTPPDGFSPHSSAAKIIQRRAAALDSGGAIDWAHAELLALGALMQRGTAIRLTGQDTRRGTFSQRHATMYDSRSGDPWNVLSGLEGSAGEVHNSPLSEMSAVGFEYGYSVTREDTLVMWEAQFGDFVNNAQSVVDELMVSGYAKWDQPSSLVLLLPHGYEGQGPNHSSAHLERFLSLAARHNMRIVYPTTAAQYYHTLLSHAAMVRDRTTRVPLVVVTGKSLLRHPLAASRLEDLSQNRFHACRTHIAEGQDFSTVKHVVLCTGKVFIDVLASDSLKESPETAVVSLEELYPMDVERVRLHLQKFTAAKKFIWLQEEPANRGAWNYMIRKQEQILGPEQSRLVYVGRSATSSPAEGASWLHKKKQENLIKRAMGGMGTDDDVS